MGRVAAAAGGALLLVMILVAGAAAGAASMFGLGSDSPPSATAAADIPAQYLALDMQAAATCPGLSWTVLAGIGKAESDFGRGLPLARLLRRDPADREPLTARRFSRFIAHSRASCPGQAKRYGSDLPDAFRGPPSS